MTFFFCWNPKTPDVVVAVDTPRDVIGYGGDADGATDPNEDYAYRVKKARDFEKRQEERIAKELERIHGSDEPKATSEGKSPPIASETRSSEDSSGVEARAPAIKRKRTRRGTRGRGRAIRPEVVEVKIPLVDELFPEMPEYLQNVTAKPQMLEEPEQRGLIDPTLFAVIAEEAELSSQEAEIFYRFLEEEQIGRAHV